MKLKSSTCTALEVNPDNLNRKLRLGPAVRASIAATVLGFQLAACSPWIADQFVFDVRETARSIRNDWVLFGSQWQERTSMENACINEYYLKNNLPGAHTSRQIDAANVACEAVSEEARRRYPR